MRIPLILVALRSPFARGFNRGPSVVAEFATPLQFHKPIRLFDPADRDIAR